MEDRFFQEGLSAHQKEILDYIDTNEEGPKSAKKLLLSLEKAVTKNSEQRLKHSEEPLKFLESEERLHNAIRELSSIGLEKEWFTSLKDAGSLDTLISLLNHENSDIVAGVFQLFAELLTENEDEEFNQDLAGQSSQLLEYLINERVVDTIAEYVSREPIEQGSDPDDLAWVHSCLLFLDEFSDSMKDRGDTEPNISTNKQIVQFLFKIIDKSPATSTKSAQAASMELLFKLFLDSPPNIPTTILGSAELTVLLNEASKYRSSAPDKDSLSIEYANNVFNVLSLVVRQSDMKKHFDDQEGMELMSILLKGPHWTRNHALDVIDQALRGFSGPLPKRLANPSDCKQLCNILKESKNGKTVFKVVSIFGSMLSWLPLGSLARDTVVVVLMSKNLAAIKHIISKRASLEKRVQQVRISAENDRETLAKETESDDNEVWLAHELRWESELANAGVEDLYACDLVLGWLLNDVSKTTVQAVEAAMQNSGVEKASVAKSLKEHLHELREIVYGLEKSEDELTLEEVNTLEETKEYIEMESVLYERL